MSKKPSVLVVGSFVMDTTTRTKVFPVAGQTVLGETYTTAPGGKGANQCMEAARLGANVTMVGKVGQDAFGDKLIESQREAGVCVDHVKRAKDGISSAIGNIIVTIDENGNALNNRIIVISGANMTITPEDVAFLKDEIKKFDMVILQFEIPMEINELVAQYAHDAGVPVMVNPAPITDIPESLMKNATYLSPNETEAARLLDCFIRDEGQPVTDEAIAGIRKAMAEKGLNKLLITLGDAGAMIVSQDELTFRESVKGITAVDPTAAGDSFVGAFCVAKCSGLDDGDAMAFANMIAAVTVSSLGAQPSEPTLEKAIAFHMAAGRDVSILEKVQKILDAE